MARAARAITSSRHFPEFEVVSGDMQNELESTKRVALLHDHVRRDVADSLRWAIAFIRANADKLPKSELLAASFNEAEKVLRTSDAIDRL